MENNEPVYGTLHVFNSATCTPIIDICGYIKIEKIDKIDKHLLRIEQSDTKFSVHKKVHIIYRSSSMAYYFIDETDNVLEKASIKTYA